MQKRQASNIMKWQVNTMRSKKIAAVVIAAITAVIPFSGKGTSGIVPPSVYAENTVSIPEWVPTDFSSAINFRDTYGHTHVEDGVVCLLFEQTLPDPASDEIPRYKLMTTENIMDTLSKRVYTSEETGISFEVVVFAPERSGEFETAVIDTWAKSASLDTGYYHAVNRYSFSVDEELNVTETDIYGWLPDCAIEFDRTPKYGDNFFVKDGYLVFCLSRGSGSMNRWQEHEKSDYFELVEMSDCSSAKDMQLDGGTINTVYAYKAVKDGHAKFSYDLCASYTTGKIAETVTADCVIIDNAQTILLPGTTKASIVDYDTGEPIPLDKDKTAAMWTSVTFYDDKGPLSTGPFMEFESNPTIFRDLAFFFNADSFSFGLDERYIPEGYTLPAKYGNSIGYFNGTVMPENYISVQKYENSSYDIKFRLKQTSVTDLEPGTVRVTVYDKDTGELISGDKLSLHNWGFGTNIRFRDPNAPNGWMYTGPVFYVESNPYTVKSDLPELYKNAEYFGFTCEDKPEVTLYDNGSMDLVFRTKIRVSGDLNSDGVFGVADVVKMQKWIHGIGELSEYSWLNADFDLDDQLTVFDLCIMKQKLIEQMYGNEAENYDFEAQYIRTNDRRTVYPKAYPKKEIITSREELDRYIAENENEYDLSSKKTAGTDTAVGFADAVEKCTDEWFKDHDLVIIVFEESSGSITHEVTSVCRYAVRICSKIPKVCTSDMAAWHILVELDKKDTIYPAFDIVFTSIETE